MLGTKDHVLIQTIKPLKNKQNAHKQMIDAALECFKRTHKLPSLRLRQNAGTGEYEQINSSLPDDCEDGMRKTTNQIPTNRNHHR